MSKNKKIILIVFIFIIFLSVFFLNSHKKIPPPFSSPYIGRGWVGIKENNISFKDDIPSEINVYDFMDRLRREGKINFTEKNYIGMGEFIDSLNGIKNNQNQSWIYYVNGVEAQVGVSNYKIKFGDIVSWKYEKSNF
jgi:hypothetical protein